MAVALTTGSYELHFFVLKLNLCRSEVLEHTQMSLATQHAFQFCSHLDATAYHHHVYIVGRSFKEDITHITAYYVAFHVQAVGHFTNEVEYLLVKYLSKFFVGIEFHVFDYE